MRAAVAGLGCRAGEERSIRFTPEAIYCDRFLLTIAKNDLGSRTRAAFLELCKALQVPPSAMDAADAHFADATFVHVGHEGGAGRSTRKLYLEFSERFHRHRAVGPGDGRFLLYVAFKWDPSCLSGEGIARYFVVSAADEKALQAAFASHRASAGLADSMRWAESILVSWPPGAPAPMLLEVEEEGNPRRSLDLNLYDWDLAVGDVAHDLTQAVRALGIDQGKAVAELDPVLHERLGHVSAGRGRSGEPFLTVYFGARAP